jgi:hypothetical protein
VTARMVPRFGSSQYAPCVASAALVSLRCRRCWSMEGAAACAIATCCAVAVSLTGGDRGQDGLAGRRTGSRSCLKCARQGRKC